MRFSEETGLQAQLRHPPSAQLIPFLVIMREFLAHSSPIYYMALWETCSHPVQRKLGFAEMKKSEAAARRLSVGHDKFVWNGQEVTNEQFYSVLSEGHFFSNEERARQTCERLLSDPLLGRLAWFKFFTFNFAVYDFLYWLFGVVFDVKDAVAPTSDVETNRCIFCLSDRASFTSMEHTFPEAFGNFHKLLPKGAVCDTCNSNNSTFESWLLDIPIITFRRTLFVPFTKKGVLPSARFGSIEVRKVSPRKIVVHALGNQSLDADQTMKQLEEWVGSKPRNAPHEIARALYKIALCVIAYERGLDFARAPHFDATRRFIRGKSRIPNELDLVILPPNRGVGAEVLEQDGRTLIDIGIFGVHFAFYVEPVAGPPIPLEFPLVHRYYLDQDLDW